jgi:hypothetical protein
MFFSKKRIKKIMWSRSALKKNRMAIASAEPDRQKFFASFFQKRSCSAFLIHTRRHGSD